MPEGATLRVTKAVQLVLSLDGVFGGGKDLAWAEKNRGSVLAAVAKSLGVPPGRVLIEFVMATRSSGDVRRLHSHGRRAQESDKVIELHVTVLVEDAADTEADLAAMAQRYQDRLLSGSTSGNPDLAKALEAELQARGQLVPAGLAVAATRPPVVVATFMAAVAEWLRGSWGPCSEACGMGRQEQRVECSLGDDLACEAELGERPQEQRQCEEHGECPFDIHCPLGRGSDLDCALQLGIALVGLSIMTACCAAMCLRKTIVTCRRHTGGTVTLSEVGIKSKYSIHRPDEPSRKTSATPRWLSTKSSADSFAMGTDGEGSVEDGKTHVVWDTDVKDLKHMFGPQLSFTAKLSEACGKTFSRAGLPRIASASRIEPDAFACASRSEGAGAAVTPNGTRVTLSDPRANDFLVAADDDELELCLGDVAAFVDAEDCGDLGAVNPWTGEDDPE